MSAVTNAIQLEKFVSDIHSQGYSIVEGVLDEAYCRKARKELEAAIEKEVHYHGSTDYPDYGMVLLCSLYGGAFIDLFDYATLTEPFEAVMGEGCIVYAYTSSSMPCVFR